MAGNAPASPERMRELNKKGQQRAIEARRERMAVHDKLAAGEISFSEAIKVPIIRHEFIRTLLLKTPHFGRVRTREFMYAFGINDSVRISKLGQNREAALVKAVEEFVRYEEDEDLRSQRMAALKSIQEGTLRFRKAVKLPCIAYEKIALIVEAVPGIGRKTAYRVLEKADTDPDKRIALIPDENLTAIIWLVESVEIGKFYRSRTFDGVLRGDRSNDEIISDIKNAISRDISRDDLHDLLYAILAVYGEARSDNVYDCQSRLREALREGATVPARVYYPMDIGCDPMVIGRTYRCPDGRLRTLSKILLGRDEKQTEFCFEDGTHFPAEGFNDREGLDA